MTYSLVPAETALLIIDMQNAFCHPDGTLGASGVNVEACQAAVSRVIPVIEACRARGIPDIWTIQEHFARDVGRESHRITPHTAKRGRVASVAGTWDAEIVAELKPYVTPESHVIRKHRFSAFYGTRLEVLLRMLGVNTLIVTGATTNACVDTTIREAYMRDLDVVVVQDAVGGLDPDLHRAACRVWHHYQGLVVDSDTLVAHLQTGAPLTPSSVVSGGSGLASRLAVDGDRLPAERGARVSHLLLQVTDLERAEAFYTNTLGFAIRKRDTLRDGRPLTVLKPGLGLAPFPAGVERGTETVDHIAFRVDDWDALVQRISDAGLPYEGPFTTEAYGRSVYVRDPDGNRIELHDR